MPELVDPHHFDFDLDRGIRLQVVEKLESSPLLALERGVGPEASGIYALYFRGHLVYVGKASKGTTKSKRTLRARLAEHVAKISGRRNIIRDMKCRYLTFSSEWWVFAAEFALITQLSARMERERIWEQGSRSGTSWDKSGKPVGRPISEAMSHARIIPITADDPEAMALSRVMGVLPFCGNHRPVPNLDNQITHGKPGLFRHPHEITMRPLRFVVVYHVRDFCQQ